LQQWLKDPDFAGVRGSQALTGLPEAERHQWQQLWNDVSGALRQAQGKTTPEEK
jgi:hypothetical protein